MKKKNYNINVEIQNKKDFKNPRFANFFLMLILFITNHIYIYFFEVFTKNLLNIMI